MKKLVFTVGNGMMGDDGAGVLLAQKLTRDPIPEWEVLNGGSAPENHLHRVRELSPEQVLLVDAVDMDLEPGTIRYIPEDQLENPFLFSTHTLPLTFLIQSLQEFVPQVRFLGVQPGLVAFGAPMTEAVRAAVDSIYNGLKYNKTGWETLTESFFNSPASLHKD